MNRKHQQNIFHAVVNVNVMKKNVNQINCGITINVNGSVKPSYM